METGRSGPLGIYPRGLLMYVGQGSFQYRAAAETRAEVALWLPYSSLRYSLLPPGGSRWSIWSIALALSPNLQSPGFLPALEASPGPW